MSTGISVTTMTTLEYGSGRPPSMADEVAYLLARDRQIVIVTAKEDGRRIGFMADLTHSASRRATPLRLKSSLPPEGVYRVLAAQLRLDVKDDPPQQLENRVGNALEQPAPRGRYVLLCESAEQYSLSTLEAIARLSNQPISIVLLGTPALRRRLRRQSLNSLNQRVTEQIRLDPKRSLKPYAWGAVILSAIALVSGLGYHFYITRPTGDPAELHPIKPKGAAVRTVTEADIERTVSTQEEPAEWRLKMSYELESATRDR